MPAFNIKGVLLKELNTRNNQTLSVNDVGFGVPYALVNNRGKMIATALASGAVPNAGQAIIEFGVLNLDAVFGVIGREVRVNLGTSVHAILPSIRRYTGLDIQTTDVENTAFSWNGDTALVMVTATSTSRAWTGATRLTLNLKPQNINALYAQLTVDLSSVPVITVRDLWLAENKRNGVYVPFDVLTIGEPVSVAGDGYNTVVSVSAKAGSGYEGAVQFRYTRRTIAQVFGTRLNVLEDVTTTRDLLPYLVALKGNIITADDIKDTEVIYADPAVNNTVSAAESSWTYAGDSSILILRRSDSVQKITLNFTNNNLAYTQEMLRQAIVAVDNGSPFADITLNIAKNVVLVGAASTAPTLVLDNYGTITQTNWYINNQGSIYGRGGNGGNGASPPGKAGGDAIRNVQSNANVVINNLGRIAGGGGGGGGWNASGRVGRGGGGAPLGVSGDGAAGTGTLSNYTNGTTGSEYPIQVDGGRGAPFSLAGGDAIQTTTSNGAVSTVAKGGAGGLAIAGNTDKVVWTKQGVVLPLPTNVAIPPYTINTGYPGIPVGVYLDPADSSKSALYFGYTAFTELRPDFFTNELGIGGTPMSGSATTAFVVCLDGKWLLVPIQTRITSLPFNALYSAGLVYGDDTVGASPPWGVVPTVQNGRFALGTELYRLRLFQGANVDPVPGGTSSVGDNLPTSDNSEWDRVMYLIQANASAPNQPGNKWTAYTDGSLLTGAGQNGSLNWTKEQHNLTLNPPSRVVRGGGVTRLGALAANSNGLTVGYRPVLEWMGTRNESEYARFLSWLASADSAEVKNRLMTTTDMSTYPYTADSQQRSQGKGTIYGNLVAVNMAPSNNVMYGSPYKSVFSDMSNWGDVFAHSMPSYNQWNASRPGPARIALILMTTSTKQAYTAQSRNLISSRSGSATDATLWSLTVQQFVYYDRTLNKMMTCSPSLGNAPSEFLFWEGSKTDLSTVITQQNLGVLPEGTNDTNFLSKVASINGVSLATSEVRFSQPTAVTGAVGNTKVTITAIGRGRYTGSVDVYFTRGASMMSIPDQYRFGDSVAFNDTQLAFLLKYLPSVIPTYFPSATATDFQDIVSFNASSYDSLTLSLNWNKYRYNTPTVINVNPKRDNWEGADLVMAFDSDRYVQAGFTDKAGNTLIGSNVYAGTTGSYPSKASLPMAYGEGLALNNAMITTTNLLPPATYSQPWSVDMWVRFMGNVMTATQQIPFMAMFAEPDTRVFTVNDRLQLGGHDATLTAMALWNNTAAARLITQPNAPLRQTGWHHVAVTYDGAAVRWYVDGVLMSTSANYTVVGGNWMLGIFATPVGGIYPVIERYRMRKGVKFALGGFVANDIYAG